MTVTDNLSAGGLYLRFQQRVEIGSALLIVVHLAGVACDDDDLKPHVFFQGEVLRVETLPSSECGYGVSSKRHRLRYLRFVNAVSLKSFRPLPRGAAEIGAPHT